MELKPFIVTYLKEQISRLIHPEVIGRVAGLGELYREATLQDQLTALPPRSATAHALHGRRHALWTGEKQGYRFCLWLWLSSSCR